MGIFVGLCLLLFSLLHPHHLDQCLSKHIIGTLEVFLNGPMISDRPLQRPMLYFAHISVGNMRDFLKYLVESANETEYDSSLPPRNLLNCYSKALLSH